MPPHFPGVVPSLYNIPNELVEEILSYLSTGDKLHVSQTTWSLHDPAARQLYRHVDVSHYSARRFFKTVTESKECYKTYTVTLQYTAACGNDVRLSCILFCDALTSLENLKRLTLRVRPHLSAYLLYMLNTRYAIQSDHRHSTSCVPPSDRSTVFHKTLRSLCTLNLHGDIKMMGVVSLVNVTALVLTEPMDVQDLVYLVNMMANGSPNTKIKALSMTVQHTLGAKIASVMCYLAEQFPAVESLSLRCPSVNAMDVSQALHVKPDVFPNIHSLHINDWSLVEPTFIIDREEATAMQHDHLVSASKTRPRFCSLRFGPLLWEKLSIYQDWEIVEMSGADTEAEGLPESYLEYPLFWDIEYDTPQDLSSVDISVIFTDTE